MSDFNAAYPGYETTARLDELRATEYSYLDEGGHVQLDYTGAGLPARSQLHAHAARLRSGVYGNPHPDNPTSSATTLLGPPTGDHARRNGGAELPRSGRAYPRCQATSVDGSRR